MRGFLIYWVPVLAWMTLVAIMSTRRFSMGNTAKFVEPLLRWLFHGISGVGLTKAHIRVREAAHFVEYLILSVLLFRAFRMGNSDPWRARWMWASIAVLALYAALAESHQKWDSGRTARISHVLMDLAGGIAGQALVAIWATTVG